MTPDAPRPPEELLSDLWDAFVAGSSVPPTDPEPDAADLADTIRRFHSLDDAPAPDPELMGDVWGRLTGGTFPTTPLVVTPATLPTRNGYNAARATAIDPIRPAETTNQRGMSVAVVRLARLLAIAVLAGLAAGFVAGVGARVAMRLAAVLAGPALQGATTDNGNTVGEITFGGTVELALFGAFVGPLGGLVYVAVRSWLPWSGWRRGALYGSLLLATFGFVVMDPTNPDYRRFGSPGVNVCAFSLVYLLFGLVAAPLADWLDRRLPTPALRRPVQLRNLAVGLALAPFALLGVAFATIGFGALGPGVGSALFAALVYGPIAVSLFLAHGRNRVPNLVRPSPQRRVAFAAYAVLAAPSLVGLVLTLRAIAGILGAG